MQEHRGHRGGRGYRGRGGWQQADLPSADDAAAWFAGRLPDEWFEGEPTITVDREEIVVIGELAAPDAGNDAGHGGPRPPRRRERRRGSVRPRRRRRRRRRRSGPDRPVPRADPGG